MCDNGFDYANASWIERELNDFIIGSASGCSEYSNNDISINVILTLIIIGLLISLFLLLL